MRTLLSISILAGLVTLAACDNTESTTAPAARVPAAVPLTQVNDGPVSQAKPAAQNGMTVTVVTSSEIPVPGFGPAQGWVECPAGTTRISGGHGFTKEGNGYSPVLVSYSLPLQPNGWVVRVFNGSNSNPVAFKVYALCAS